jgi:hypothetical protein
MTAIASPTFGVLGQALWFDGSVDTTAVDIPDDSVFDFEMSGTYTWSMWVKPDAFTEWSTAWAQDRNISQYFYIYVHTTTQEFFGPVTAGVSAGFLEGGAVTDRIMVHTTDNTLTTGEWAHVTVTYDGALASTSRFSIFVDGVDVTDTTDVHTEGTYLQDITPTTIRIGNSSVYADEDFGGAIDDVRYYTRVLSDDEIQRLYMLGR